MFFENIVMFFILAHSQQMFSILISASEDSAITNPVIVTKNTTEETFYNFSATKNSSGTHHKSIHDVFLSAKSHDYDVFQEITKLTRNHKQSNATLDLIDIINEYVSETEKAVTEVKTNFEPAIKFNFEDEVKKIQALKEYYNEMENKIMDINNFMDNDSNKSRTASTHESVVEPESTTPYKLTTTLKSKNESRNSDDIDFWSGEEENYPISGRRVFGGKRTKVKYFPFMASIQLFGRFQCGGSIIKSDLVITAASCLQIAWNNRFYRENPSFLSVRVGSNWYEGGGEVINVIELFFHPNYSPKNLHHNLAITRLQRNIKFLKKKRALKKIAIHDSANKLPLDTKTVTIVGWGATVQSNIIFDADLNRMKYAQLSVYPLEDCQEVYSKEYVTDRHFCAGFISSGDGACNKDVGGPGIVAGVLAGVISFGAPVCGVPDAPTVFINIGYYNDWIEEIMEMPVRWHYQRTTTTTPRYWLYTTPEKIATIFHVDEVLFKGYLKTMFESKEIKDYLEAARATDTTKSHLSSVHPTYTVRPTSSVSTWYTPYETEADVTVRKTLLRMNTDYSIAQNMFERSIEVSPKLRKIEPIMTPDSNSGVFVAKIPHTTTRIKSYKNAAILTTQDILSITPREPKTQSQLSSQIFEPENSVEFATTLGEFDPIPEYTEASTIKMPVTKTKSYKKISTSSPSQVPEETFVLDVSGIDESKQKKENETPTEEPDPDKELIERIIELAQNDPETVPSTVLIEEPVHQPAKYQEPFHKIPLSGNKINRFNHNNHNIPKQTAVPKRSDLLKAKNLYFLRQNVGEQLYLTEDEEENKNPQLNIGDNSNSSLRKYDLAPINVEENLEKQESDTVNLLSELVQQNIGKDKASNLLSNADVVKVLKEVVNEELKEEPNTIVTNGPQNIQTENGINFGALSSFKATQTEENSDEHFFKPCTAAILDDSDSSFENHDYEIINV